MKKGLHVAENVAQNPLVKMAASAVPLLVRDLDHLEAREPGFFKNALLVFSFVLLLVNLLNPVL